MPIRFRIVKYTVLLVFIKYTRLSFIGVTLKQSVSGNLVCLDQSRRDENNGHKQIFDRILLPLMKVTEGYK